MICLNCRIGFGFGARHEAVVLGLKNHRQIAVHLRAEPLENSKLFKKRTGKNENIFICNSHIIFRI